MGAWLPSPLIALVLLGTLGGTAPVAAQSAVEYALLTALASGASQPAGALGSALNNALTNATLALDATAAPQELPTAETELVDVIESMDHAEDMTNGHVEGEVAAEEQAASAGDLEQQDSPT